MFSLNSNIKNIELWPLILSLFQVKKNVWFAVVSIFSHGFNYLGIVN